MSVPLSLNILDKWNTTGRLKLWTFTTITSDKVVQAEGKTWINFGERQLVIQKKKTGKNQNRVAFNKWALQGKITSNSSGKETGKDTVAFGQAMDRDGEGRATATFFPWTARLGPSPPKVCQKKGQFCTKFVHRGTTQKPGSTLLRDGSPFHLTWQQAESIEDAALLYPYIVRTAPCLETATNRTLSDMEQV